MIESISCVIPEITIHNNRAITTSIAVANFFQKEHKNVLQKIRSLECSPAFTTANFSAVVVNTVAGFNERETEAYEMTRNGFIFLVMGFTGKKAAAFKEAYIAEFDRMETELQKSATALPTYPPFSDDYANRAEIIYYHDFRPIFCRILQPGEEVISHESMKEWLEKQGLVFFTREELRTITLEKLLSL